MPEYLLRHLPLVVKPLLKIALAVLASSWMPSDAASVPFDAAPAPIAGQGYRMVQDWNFVTDIRTRSALDRSFYTRYLYDGGQLDHLGDEWERYRDNQNHVFAPGSLQLIARAHGTLQPGNIESGMIRSKWTGLYGYYEAEVRVPKGRSLWPAFWLNPEDGVWPPEIDVFEIVDGPRDSTACSFHFLHPAAGRVSPDKSSRLDMLNRYCPGWDFASGFHRMAVLWTADRVEHYVDGTLVVSRAFSWTHADGHSAGPAHIILNLAVGGQWAGAPVTASIFPAALEIRHVRVWQQSKP